ncbi:hypothetical protein MACH18_21810 [Phaeobacter italicus]|uniref:hypothetical protein n=1 Tax=Phaeobacter italicus TaxID=481446 RepID=UPI00275797CA|nr:hypothetical protein [Phaeobacter italicus]GLO75101.1 hypothetical protein MACH18_21810 [Phaeobacter italicus]
MPWRSKKSPKVSSKVVIPVCLAALTGCVTPENGGSDLPSFFSPVANAKIYPLGGNSFEVVPEIGAESAAYWCAASDYARRGLGAGWSDRIFVSNGQANSVVTGRIDAVTFTLEPIEREQPKPLLRLGFTLKRGDSQTVSAANGFCQDLLPVLFF